MRHNPVIPNVPRTLALLATLGIVTAVVANLPAVGAALDTAFTFVMMIAAYAVATLAAFGTVALILAVLFGLADNAIRNLRSN